MKRQLLDRMRRRLPGSGEEKYEKHPISGDYHGIDHDALKFGSNMTSSDNSHSNRSSCTISTMVSTEPPSLQSSPPPPNCVSPSHLNDDYDLDCGSTPIGRSNNHATVSIAASVSTAASASGSISSTSGSANGSTSGSGSKGGSITSAAGTTGATNHRKRVYMIGAMANHPTPILSQTSASLMSDHDDVFVRQPKRLQTSPPHELQHMHALEGLDPQLRAQLHAQLQAQLQSQSMLDASLRTGTASHGALNQYSANINSLHPPATVQSLNPSTAYPATFTDSRSAVGVSGDFNIASNTIASNAMSMPANGGFFGGCGGDFGSDPGAAGPPPTLFAACCSPFSVLQQTSNEDDHQHAASSFTTANARAMQIPSNPQHADQQQTHQQRKKKQASGPIAMAATMWMQHKQQKELRQTKELRTVEDSYLANELERLSLAEQQAVAKDLQPDAVSSADNAPSSANPNLFVIQSSQRQGPSPHTHRGASPVSVDGSAASPTTADPVMDPPEESPENLQRLLDEMDHEMSKLRKHKEWYEKAAFLSPWYVRDVKFRLAFLRADRYDAKRAAFRLATHFQIKAKIFGDDLEAGSDAAPQPASNNKSQASSATSLELLAKPITWDDLDEETQRCYLTGQAMYLPNVRDRGGRGIFICCARLWDSSKFSTGAVLRAYWYTVMGTCMDDEESQKRGLIALYMAHNGTLGQTVQCAQILAKGQFDKCLPIRCAGLYMCLDNSSGGMIGGESSATPSITSFFGNYFQKSICQAMRVRVRTIFGSFLECYYQLSIMGIPTDKLPYTCFGELDPSKQSVAVAAHRAVENKFVESDRQNIEREREHLLLEAAEDADDNGDDDDGNTNGTKKTSKQTKKKKKANGSAQDQGTDFTRNHQLIVHPNRHDVLLGRGRPYQNYIGNVRLFEHIEACKDAHGALEKQRREKTDLSRRIVRLIQSNGGRFLRRAGPGWMEVDDDQARIKVAMGFRNLARNKRKQK